MVADLSFYIILPALHIIIQSSEALVLPAKPRVLLCFSIYIIFMLNSGRNTLSKYELFLRSIPNISGNLLC